MVLDAFRDLWARRPDAHLLLVSTDAVPASLAARVDGLGCGGRVRAFGRRSIDERDELMAAVDVAVLSQAPGPFDEPSPMLATLLAAGVPTILDERGGLDGDLEPFVRRYDWAEEGPAGLLGQLTAIAEAPSEALALARSAREVVTRRQGWARVIASYVELIEHCHAGCPRSARPPHFRARSSWYPVLVE